MKLKFNNNFQSSDFKKRAIVITLFVILLLGLGGFVTYQTLELLNTKSDISDFKAQLEKLATVEQNQVSTSKIVQGKFKSPEISIYGNQLTDISPFKSLLRAVPEPKPKQKQQKDGSQADKAVKQKPQKKQKQKKKSKEEIKQKIKHKLQNKLKILGILETSTSKTAIIKYGGQSSQMVKEGREFAGLKVKRITKNKLIVEDKKNEFTYTFGGEED